MSSQHEWEEADWQDVLGEIEGCEHAYDSTTPRGRRFLRCEHERLQSLLKQRKTS